MARFSDLPFEVIALIFQREYYTDVPLEEKLFFTPITISLVCKDWKPFGQAILWYTLRFSPLDRHQFNTLLDSPYLGKFVRVVDCSESALRNYRAPKLPSAYDYLVSVGLSRLDEVLQSCPEIRSLSLLGASPDVLIFMLKYIASSLETLNWSMYDDVYIGRVTIQDLHSSLLSQPRLTNFSLEMGDVMPFLLPRDQDTTELSKLSLKNFDLEITAVDTNTSTKNYWGPQLLNITNFSTLESVHLRFINYNFDCSQFDFSNLKNLTLGFDSSHYIPIGNSRSHHSHLFWTAVHSILPQCHQLEYLSLPNEEVEPRLSSDVLKIIPRTLKTLSLSGFENDNDEHNELVERFWIDGICPHLNDLIVPLYSDSVEDYEDFEYNMVEELEERYPRNTKEVEVCQMDR